MFRGTHSDTVPPTHLDVDHPSERLIPLSVLQLDLDAPPVGSWDANFSGRGIPVVTDDIGRKVISRADARQLFDERREDEIRRREVAARQEQQAIEADQRWRSQLNRSTPWYEIPAGVSPAEAWA